MSSVTAHSVLIVEDERIVAKDLQQTLVGMGYDAYAIAASADEAIARATERCPDVVLMDIRIKGQRDGIEAAEILRREFGVPVIYLTAHSDDATIERAKRTEPHGYLLKPVKSAELRSVIEVSIYKHGMERRLRERERWYSTTLLSIADAVISVDLAANVTFMNPAAESLTGFTAADALGRPARDIVRLFDVHANRLREGPLDQALRERRTVELAEATLERSIDTLLITNSASPILDDERLLGAVMVFRDVTAMRTMEKQLELADRLASLGTLAAGVAHEINNPLAVVALNSELVLDGLAKMRAALDAASAPGAITSEIDEMIEAQLDTRAATSRMGRIVSDLRKFSRPTQELVALTDVARSVEWAVRSTSTEFRDRARLVSRVADDLPLVRVDETKLGQVFVNLLLNAAQAIIPGNAEANEVSIVAEPGNDGRVVVQVRDSGSGMSGATLKHMFEPFFTTKSSSIGTGLGLSVCHGIVKAFGGELQVESQMGEGTVFRVLLPLAPAVGLPRTSLPHDVPARRRRILIVDDEESILRVLARILDEHDVVCTQRGEEVLARLEAGEQFDAILSDVLMPGVTGMELFEALLSRFPDAARRVVFLSGGTTTPQTVDFLNSVPNPRMEKPFDIALLRETLASVFDPDP